MVSFESFKIDLAADGWHFVKEEQPARIWVNPYRDLMQQRLILEAPGDLPPDYPNIDSQRAFFEAHSREWQYGVIAVDQLFLKGASGFSTLFKFKTPQNKLGHRILGTMMLTFDRFFCGFQFQADEQGTTGEREAGVYMILKAQGKLPPAPPAEEKPAPRVLSSMDEYFDILRERPVAVSPSDAEEFDEAFPNHPLSRVRRYMKRVAETIEFDDEVRQAKPFRGAEWTPEV